MYELSSAPNSDEVSVDIISENQTETKNSSGGPIFDEDIEDLKKQLELEKQKSLEYEQKLKYALADYQNLNKKTHSDIENGINAKIDEFMLDFLKIYDDFSRAKEVFSDSKINSDGLNSILKNMDSLLQKYNVIPIDALGEIFDPNLHEAISVIADPDLDENTIIKEIRKGYISQKRVVKPSLVEISKKDNDKK